MNTRKRPPAAKWTSTLLVALVMTCGAACSSGDTDDAQPNPESSNSAKSDDSASADDAKALNTYVDAMRPQVEKEMEQFSDTYSDFAVEAEGSRTLVYRYTYRMPMHPEKTREQLQAAEETLGAEATTNLFPEMEGAGIKNPAAKWVYLNHDGLEITTLSFED